MFAETFSAPDLPPGLFAYLFRHTHEKGIFLRTDVCRNGIKVDIYWQISLITLAKNYYPMNQLPV